jgi:hypothetical protein
MITHFSESNTRGKANFSFPSENYFNRERVRFVNDDTIAGGASFSTHCSRNYGNHHYPT